MPYLLAGELYCGPFRLDAAFTGPIVGVPDLIAGSDLLQFADIPPPSRKSYPLAQGVPEAVWPWRNGRRSPERCDLGTEA